MTLLKKLYCLDNALANKNNKYHTYYFYKNPQRLKYFIAHFSYISLFLGSIFLLSYCSLYFNISFSDNYSLNYIPLNYLFSIDFFIIYMLTVLMISVIDLFFSFQCAFNGTKNSSEILICNKKQKKDEDFYISIIFGLHAFKIIYFIFIDFTLFFKKKIQEGKTKQSIISMNQQKTDILDSILNNKELLVSIIQSSKDNEEMIAYTKNIQPLLKDSIDNEMKKYENYSKEEILTMISAENKEYSQIGIVNE